MLVIKSQGFGKITNGEYYISHDGKFRVMRETGVQVVDGGCMIELNGRWVLREAITNRYIDHDRYRNDLFERNNIRMMNTRHRNNMVIS